MNHVFGCLLLAEITGRIPVTHWGKNSLYGDETDTDAFQLYFEAISPLGIPDVHPGRKQRRGLPAKVADRDATTGTAVELEASALANTWHHLSRTPRNCRCQ